MATAPTLADIFQWDVTTWSRALPVWQAWVTEHRPKHALAIGEREGGLSLWLASCGCRVLCTDLRPFPRETQELHRAHGLERSIEYQQQDVLALSLPAASLDVVIFKSVIGALGSKVKQRAAMEEIIRVLKPGGALLFAENLGGTRLHVWLRHRFIAWDHYWRYLQMPADRDLFDAFERVDLHTTGLLHNLGRSERQRTMLATIDRVLAPITPAAWHTVLHGVCIKAG